VRIALVGQPNVGKSLLMNRLTGASAFVSNYPGTTVEVTAGKIRGLPGVEAIDTPGVYSLRAGSPDQQITRRILLTEDLDALLNVVDATNLERNLYLTLELLDFGLPVIVALNQHDRLKPLGMKIDHALLGRMLGVPVVPVSAAERTGLARLLSEVRRIPPASAITTPDIEPVIVAGVSALDALRKRSSEIASATVSRDGARESASGRSPLDNPMFIMVALTLGVYSAVLGIAYGLRVSESAASTVFRPVQLWLEGLARLVIGDVPRAGTVARGIAEGLMVPFGTVMPSMAMVYFLMALLEDSGLLSRFAAASDAAASLMGLPGQSLVPLALGLGCRSPALLASRLLPGARARMIVILLLAIAVPCAATLGIVSAVAARFRADLPVVMLTLAAVFALLGIGANRLLPGRPVPLIIEMPPVRLPVLSNVAQKTWSRMSGFFTHVLPVLLCMNILVRIMVESGALDLPSSLSASTLPFLGVRAEVLAGVVVTAFQRYLAPVVLLNLDLSAREATIACAMVCTSFPCMPVTALSLREIGLRRTAIIFMIGAALPVLVATALNLILS
jgi:ferrous iron transport protein B